MNKLISISVKTLLRKLHNGEHYRFFDIAIIKTIVALMASMPQVSGIFNALKTVFEKEDALYKLSLGSILTKEIGNLNDKRRAFFAYFWASVAIARYKSNAGFVAAVEILEFLHNIYKDMLRANYYDMSGMMINFLEDCEKPAYKPSIQLLGLADVVDELKAAHEAFDNLYEERSADKGNLADLGKLAEVRVEVDDIFVTFIDALNTTWTANELGAKDPTLRTKLLEVKGAITNAINEAELVLTRRGHHKAKDDGTQTPDATNPPAPTTPPQQPDTTLPPAPETPDQNPVAVPPGINPEDLNPPEAGE